METEPEGYVLKPVHGDTFEFIRNLRNDPRNSAAFIKAEYITRESHLRYMQDHKFDYFVCFRDNLPVGFIGVVNNDIRLAVDFEFRNQGVANFMVREIMKIFPEATAKVKISNSASIALFDSLDFEKKFIVFEKKS